MLLRSYQNFIVLTMGLKPSPSGESFRFYSALLQCGVWSTIEQDLIHVLTSNITLCGVTKYRKSVLTGSVGVRLRDLVREICRTYEIEILQGSVSPDHVHVLLSCPPNLSPSKVMQYIKGKSSRKLMMEFKHIQKQYWGRQLWARGYFVASSGNVTDEVIMEYIRQQEGTEPDDGGENFRVTQS